MIIQLQNLITSMNLVFIMVKTASGVYALTYRRNNVTSSRRREYMTNMTSWYLQLAVNIFVNFWREMRNEDIPKELEDQAIWIYKIQKNDILWLKGPFLATAVIYSWKKFFTTFTIFAFSPEFCKLLRNAIMFINPFPTVLFLWFLMVFQHGIFNRFL